MATYSELKRNFRIAVLSMTLCVLGSIAICVWTLVNVRQEYAAQIEILRSAIGQNGIYKNGHAFIEVKQELPGQLEF